MKDKIKNNIDNCKTSPFDNSTPEWVEIIRDLHNGVGCSYSAIAHNSGLTVSAVQRLATGAIEKPKYSAVIALAKVYYEVFYESRSIISYINRHLQLKKNHNLDRIKDISNYIREQND